MQSGYNINDLVQEAQSRWLKPAEVLSILQNHEDHQLTHQPPQKPPNGHSWRRKKDGRTVGEAHERLKVGNVEALNCYYAHGEQNPNFQRRSYWILDPKYEHIVLVHYRDISEARHNGGSISRLSQASPSHLSRSPTSYTAQLPGSTAIMSERCDPCQSQSSPASVEVSSDAVIRSNGISQTGVTERTVEVDGSSDIEISEALRRLEEQLSLNDDNLTELCPLYDESENSNNSEYTTPNESYSGLSSIQNPNSLLQELYSGSNEEHHHQMLGNGCTVGSKSSISWKQMLDSCENSPVDKSQEKHDMIPPPSRSKLVQDHQNSHLIDSEGNNSQEASLLLPQEVENFKFPSYSPSINICGHNPDYYTTLFDHDQFEMPLEGGSSLTSVGKQKFTIWEISPEWGYASEATKVFIIGSFLCDPSDCPWTCMFGDIEVPLQIFQVQIFQEGVVYCQAPPHLPGKVTLCITSGNRESCSEVREFEYRDKPGISANNSLSELEVNRSPDELLLLVRFVQMLLSDLSMQKGESNEPGINLLGKSKAGEDSWSEVIESILVGSWTPSRTMDWLLQELLKDKLLQWLSSRSQEGSEQAGSFLSKKEQGIIHMIAGLGFQWALNPILDSGVNVNFRDINGWTALHWAARFGREKMVASLLASGALAGAVTDPNSQDPIGKTAASIAATCGHKGLAGYLSEVALTSHLSSLTLEESELTKGSANVEAEKTVNSVSKTTVTANEDQLSLQDTLAAVRNAAQAAARIQSAFRAHSFRKRQQKEAAAAAAAAAVGDKYCDIQGLLAASKLAFCSMRDYNAAALSIQKKYRGWKGRKDFLAFRRKVVKIQAHVRGHQVRKIYRVRWATSILEKVILRWRRKGVGLRGFHNESEIDYSDDEDILKVFRKQKVDAAIDEAVARVLSMVESPDARQQYRRMLEKYRQAKAELQNTESEAALTSQGDIFSMESEDMYLFT